MSVMFDEFILIFIVEFTINFIETYFIHDITNNPGENLCNFRKFLNGKSTFPNDYKHFE